MMKRKRSSSAAACLAFAVATAALVYPIGGEMPTKADEATAHAVRSIVFDYERNEVIVDGTRKPPIYPMTNHNGRIYVAARQIAEVFGYAAEWDPKSYDAVLRNDTTSVQVNSEARQAWVNDIPVPYEGLGIVQEGRLLLSIRAIADYMGLHVHYDTRKRQALVADAVYPYLYAAEGERPNVVGIDFARYGRYPIAESEEERETSRALLFSDSPETFRDYGLLYRDAAVGKARVYLTHVNGLQGKDAVVALFATNPSDRAVTVTLTRQGVADRSKDYARQGAQALKQWHDEKALQPPKATVLSPGETTLIYVTETLRVMDGAHAIFDLESQDGEVIYETVAAPASSDPLSFRKDARPLDRDIHDRGTFPVSDIELRTDAATWRAGEPTRLKIGVTGSIYGHWAEGTDALTGLPAQDFGNFGIFYHLTVERPPEAVYVLVPLRGLYRGAIDFDGETVETPALKVGEGYVIGRTTGREEAVELVASAASGSYMPFEILVFPL